MTGAFTSSVACRVVLSTSLLLLQFYSRFPQKIHGVPCFIQTDLREKLGLSALLGGHTFPGYLQTENQLGPHCPQFLEHPSPDICETHLKNNFISEPLRDPLFRTAHNICRFFFESLPEMQRSDLNACCGL